MLKNVGHRIIKISSVFILTLIAVAPFSFWILAGERKFDISIKEIKPLSPSPLPRSIEKLKEKPIGEKPEENITKLVAEEIGRELIEKNKNGPIEDGENFKFISSNPELVANNLMQKLNPEKIFSFEEVDIKELKISTKDNSETQRAYLENLKNAFSEIFGPPNDRIVLEALEEILTSKEKQKLSDLIEKHEIMISKLKSTPVPYSLFDFHKREINLLIKTKAMLENFAVANEDPMRAYLAFDLFPILGEEAARLNEEFSVALHKVVSYDNRPILARFFVKEVWAVVITWEINPLLTNILPRDMVEWIRRLLTDKIKDILLWLLQDLVLKWIKGELGVGEVCRYEPYRAPDGSTYCPKFVMNWQKAIFKAQETSDTRLAKEILDSKLRPETKKVLIEELIPESNKEGYGLQYDEIYNLPELTCDTGDLFQDIMCMTEPINSYSVKSRIAKIRQEELRSAYMEGRKDEIVGNQGFESTKKCMKEQKNPKTGKTECIEWATTEPGSVTEEIAAEMSRKDWQRIENAYDLESLLINIALMFIKMLLAAGEEGLLGIAKTGSSPPPPGLPTFVPPSEQPPPSEEPVPVRIVAPLPVPVEVTNPWCCNNEGGGNGGGGGQ